MGRLAGALIVLTMISTGCGANSPAAPSTPPPAGATITGSITVPGHGASTMSGGRPTHVVSLAGTVVTVQGTSLSATIDSANRFTLREVPAGNPQLKFFGPGVDAGLGLSSVANEEEISLALRLENGAIVIESIARTTRQ